MQGFLHIALTNIHKDTFRHLSRARPSNHQELHMPWAWQVGEVTTGAADMPCLETTQREPISHVIYGAWQCDSKVLLCASGTAQFHMDHKLTILKLAFSSYNFFTLYWSSHCTCKCANTTGLTPDKKGLIWYLHYGCQRIFA